MVSQVIAAIEVTAGVVEVVDWIVAKLVDKDKFIFAIKPLR